MPQRQPEFVPFDPDHDLIGFVLSLAHRGVRVRPAEGCDRPDDQQPVLGYEGRS